MKFLKNKVLISVLLTLMFSVAVSGGCGGGGGGHYSGNFGDSGDSSQNTTPEDVTIENISSDVAPIEPDEPALSDQFASENGDDEYGAGKIPINSFTLLNKTTWSIDQIVIHHSSQSYDVLEGNSHNTDTITFLMSGDEMKTMAWATQDAKRTPISDDLTVKFRDPSASEGELTMPILRSATFSIFGTDSHGYDYYQSSNLSRMGIETIEVESRLKDLPNVSTKLLIKNQVRLNKKSYTCELNLSRVGNFLLLDQTDWQIKNVRVVGLIKDSKGNYVCGNPKNYPVDFNPKENTDKITLFTEGDGYFAFTKNDGEKLEYSELKFRDKALKKDFNAKIIRSAQNFEYEDTNEKTGYDIYGVTGTSTVLPENFRDKDHKIQELLYVSEYGPNSYVTLYNSFYVKDTDSQGRTVYRFYWAILDLEPYNPNKK